ncbi:MAG TPA: hypothetical protein VF280_07520 [Burkholderiales bacterium]|jgi:uncharacterized membrane protein YeaQ/YmgE (transglycosylase-associated protein family)
MELVLWVVGGAALGWLAIAKLRFNEQRGTLVSMIIGAVGGVLGGKMVAPMLGFGSAVPGEFSMAVMFVVLATAGACLALGNMVSNRFGV